MKFLEKFCHNFGAKWTNFHIFGSCGLINGHTIEVPKLEINKMIKAFQVKRHSLDLGQPFLLKED